MVRTLAKLRDVTGHLVTTLAASMLASSGIESRLVEMDSKPKQSIQRT